MTFKTPPRMLFPEVRMELWDLYNALGQRTGKTMARGNPVPEGYFHAVADVAVRHADGSFLFTLRDRNKPVFPGKWELGAGGSVIHGEEILDGARRELLEETGLIADALTPAFYIIRPENHTIYQGYLAEYAGNKDAVRLQEGETIDYRWLSAAETVAFMQSDDCIAPQRDRWQVLLHQLEAEK